MVGRRRPGKALRERSRWLLLRSMIVLVFVVEPRPTASMWVPLQEDEEEVENRPINRQWRCKAGEVYIGTPCWLAFLPWPVSLHAQPHARFGSGSALCVSGPVSLASPAVHGRGGSHLLPATFFPSSEHAPYGRQGGDCRRC